MASPEAYGEESGVKRRLTETYRGRSCGTLRVRRYAAFVPP